MGSPGKQYEKIHKAGTILKKDVYDDELHCFLCTDYRLYTFLYVSDILMVSAGEKF